jgi:hypothetical protein
MDSGGSFEVGFHPRKKPQIAQISADKPIASIADCPQITQMDADSIAQILEGQYDFVGAFSMLDRV